MAIPILAVDDSASIREMIVAVLAPRGYHVLTAADGCAALEVLRSATETYIVLLDVVMPGMDGPEVVRELARDSALRSANHRVVLMSSPLRLTARDIPATMEQLAKPFTRQQLVELVERLSR
jgi:CheY-like chemotaxis protein